MKFILFLLYSTSALQFNKNKFFTPHNKKSKDIQFVDKQTANLIGRNWLYDIDVYCDIDFSFNTKHELYSTTVDKINKLEQYVQESNKGIYLLWNPKNNLNMEEVLFIIVCEKVNDTYTIKHLIQSPYWYENYIQSVHLKMALDDYTNNTIDLTKFYENDIKYKLAWRTWYIK
tara:strand:- start:103 stop:621 length:519 start_codon:yes stop_codon:yes gene_type:complete